MRYSCTAFSSISFLKRSLILITAVFLYSGFLPVKGQIGERIDLPQNIVSELRNGDKTLTPVSYLDDGTILAVYKNNFLSEKQDIRNNKHMAGDIINLSTGETLYSSGNPINDFFDQHSTFNYTSATSNGKLAWRESYWKAADCYGELYYKDNPSAPRNACFRRHSSNTIKFFDYKTGKNKTFRFPESSFDGLSMSTDGRKLIAWDEEGYDEYKILMWDLNSYSKIKEFKIPQFSRPGSQNTYSYADAARIYVNNDGTRIISVTVYGHIYVFDTQGKLLKKIEDNYHSSQGKDLGLRHHKMSPSRDHLVLSYYNYDNNSTKFVYLDLKSDKKVSFTIDKYVFDYDFFDNNKKLLISYKQIKDKSSGSYYYKLQTWNLTQGRRIGIDNQSNVGGGQILSNKKNDSFIANCSSCNSNSVYLYHPSTKGYIESKVKERIAQWQQKDMYETTEAYQKRVTEQKRRALIDDYTNKLVDSLAVATFSERITDYAYDADNQAFELTFSNGTSIYLPVPLEDARTFGNNIQNIRFSDEDYGLNESGKFILRNAKVYNSSTGNTYTYDSGQQVAFNTTQMAANFDPIDVNVDTDDSGPNVKKGTRKIEVGKADVDVNVPETAMSNPDAIAVVIGNRNYQGDTPDVDYAVNDARTVKEYLIKTLGFKEGNILYRENASKSRMEVLLGDDRNQGRLADYLKPGRSDVFFFYSGHGAPDPNTETGYLMPVDADASALSITGYPLDVLYDNLGKLDARSVNVVIDACFSGATGGGEMLVQNASPIGIEVRNPAAKLETGFVVTASSGSQISSWYPQKGHGLLTYFWLKALQGDADADEDGTVTTTEIKQYLTDPTDGLPYWARRLHNREQTPQVFGADAQKILVKYQ